MYLGKQQAPSFAPGRGSWIPDRPKTADMDAVPRLIDPEKPIKIDHLRADTRATRGSIAEVNSAPYPRTTRARRNQWVG